MPQEQWQAAAATTEQEEEEEAPNDELSTSRRDEQRHVGTASLLEEFERVAALASNSSSSNNNSEAIISHDCCISNDVQANAISSTTKTIDMPTVEKVEATPSAPIAPVANVPLVQYPNLIPMRLTNALIEEQSSKVVYKPKVDHSSGYVLASSNLKPFTSEQLRELYHCADLELAKQFELEFLMNTLLESSETDPLYLALQEYYNLQGKLTSNLHDIKRKRKECKDAQQEVWQREPVTRSFSATCGDGNVVSESVTYE